MGAVHAPPPAAFPVCDPLAGEAPLPVWGAEDVALPPMWPQRERCTRLVTLSASGGAEVHSGHSHLEGQLLSLPVHMPCFCSHSC